MAALPPAARATEVYRLAPAQAAMAHRLAVLRLVLHFGVELGVIGLLLVLLESGAAGALAQGVERRVRREWARTAVFAAALLVALEVLVLTPLQALGHQASLRAGISIQGWSGWARDQAMVFAMMLVVGVPILVVARWLLRRWPRRAWLWFRLGLIPVILVAALILPQLVEPLFDHFEPLATTHPELVAQFERVVARTGTAIPPERMFLMRASVKGNGLNAYVSGIGPTKRIVVWDTTADRMPEDEILFILAHESGHYVLHHLAWGLALGIAGTGLLLWLTLSLARGLLRLAGRRWGVDALGTLPGLVVVLLALMLLEAASEPVGNTISRRIEHQADVYGQEAMHGIVADPQRTAAAAFQQLGEAWLEEPHPNPLVVFWTYDHPSIASRAKFAAQYDPWTAGGEPQYFRPDAK